MVMPKLIDDSYKTYEPTEHEIRTVIFVWGCSRKAAITKIRSALMNGYSLVTPGSILYKRVDGEWRVLVDPNIS